MYLKAVVALCPTVSRKRMMGGGAAAAVACIQRAGAGREGGRTECGTSPHRDNVGAIALYWDAPS